MARVTVEDCIKHFDSNYDLVLQASKRARAIADGAEPLVERDNDKPTVIALREIADEVVPQEEVAVEAAQLEQDPFEISIEA